MEKNKRQSTTKLSKGIFDLAILLLLSKRAMYGYEITKKLRDGESFFIADGSVYPILRRLTSQKLVNTYREEYEGRSRVYYFCTDKGKQLADEQFQQLSELFQFLKSTKEEELDEEI